MDEPQNEPQIRPDNTMYQSADTAIAQIKRQEYAGALSAFAGEVLLVGINYNKKTKKHECRIERWKKTQGVAGGNSSSNTEKSRSTQGVARKTLGVT